jgi:hypothetical protein
MRGALAYCYKYMHTEARALTATELQLCRLLLVRSVLPQHYALLSTAIASVRSGCLHVSHCCYTQLLFAIAHRYCYYCYTLLPLITAGSFLSQLLLV